MALTAQDKICHVANKLGLTTLKEMQGSTGAVYDVDDERSGQIFTSASRHSNPGRTNLTQNQFEVNEALLIENIAFYTVEFDDPEAGLFYNNLQRSYGSNCVIIFDLIIANKRVMKDTPVFGSGMPYTFANVANQANDYIPRHQIFMEGAGILIPPQVQFSIEYRLFDIVTGDTIPISETVKIGCYLFGTRVLLNFNTSI